MQECRRRQAFALPVDGDLIIEKSSRSLKTSGDSSMGDFLRASTVSDAVWCCNPRPARKPVTLRLRAASVPSSGVVVQQNGSFLLHTRV